MRPASCDAWCGLCRKLVPTEWREVTWDDHGRPHTEKQVVLVEHFTASTTGAYLVRCGESGKRPWPTPEQGWMTVSEDRYESSEPIPAVDVPYQTGTYGMTANMHYVPSGIEGIGLGPLGEYGCLDAPFED